MTASEMLYDKYAKEVEMHEQRGSNVTYNKSERAQGNIQSALDKQSVVLDSLSEALGGLFSTINPVLRTSYPDPPSEVSDKASVDMHSSLTMDINKLTSRIQQMTLEVRQHIDRIDL